MTRTFGLVAVLFFFGLSGCLRGAEVVPSESDSGAVDPGPTGATDTDTGDGPPGPEGLQVPELTLTYGFNALELSWGRDPAVTAGWRLERTSRVGTRSVVAELEPSTTSITLETSLVLAWGSSFVLYACDADDCVPSDPLDVGNDLSNAVGRLQSVPAVSRTQLGTSVATCDDGSRVAVGMPGDAGGDGGVDPADTGAVADRSGVVLVYALRPGGYVPESRIKARVPVADSQFGDQVALSGDCETLAVGVPDHAGTAAGITTNEGGTSSPGSGAAYVFTIIDGRWEQVAFIKADNPNPGDRFGTSLALDFAGTNLVVGAPFEDSPDTGVLEEPDLPGDVEGSDSGAVYSYVRGPAPTGWSRDWYIKAVTTVSDGNFGRSVSLDGTGGRLAVGAPGRGGIPDGQGAPGSAIVYSRLPTTGQWRNDGPVSDPQGMIGDEFGRAVALSRDGLRLVVGAPSADGSEVNAGRVLVFRWNGGFDFEASVVPPTSTIDDSFGGALALGPVGDRLVVGAAFEDGAATAMNVPPTDDDAQNSGIAYVFRLDVPDGLVAVLKPPREAPLALAGSSVAAADESVFVGAPGIGIDVGGVGFGPWPDPAAGARSHGAVFVY